DTSRPLRRRERLRLAFGEDGAPWDEERVLDRYELLYGAGFVAEAPRDGRANPSDTDEPPLFGVPMRFDHRRILATAISRLRAKLKYRPVIFELMPVEFTLTELQRTVEAISGRHLHKQNFRRLVESTALVEPTGKHAQQERGRPAELFRFRREVLKERPAPGLRVGRRG
ncbi:MAG: NAD regulator, partial [Acidimicrobiia bacterium]|nr:NAD regulator [Acidimicrobiia bacterium]